MHTYTIQLPACKCNLAPLTLPCYIQCMYQESIFIMPYILYPFSSHDNSRLVSGGVDKMVMLTDVGTGQPIRKLRGHLSVRMECHERRRLLHFVYFIFVQRINCVKFNEESSLIISGNFF